LLLEPIPRICLLRTRYELSAVVESSSVRDAISGYRRLSPLLGLMGSAGAVAAGGTVGLPALATAVTVAGVAVGVSGAADDRPAAGGGLAGPALAVQLEHHVAPKMAYSSSRRTHW
jgi:hypothetical protein